MSLPRLSLVLLVACAGPRAPAPSRDAAAARIYTAEEADAMIEVVNTATPDALDHDVPLDGRAVDHIVTRRAVAPFQTVDEIDAVPYVGPAALDALRAYAERIGLLDATGGELGYTAEEVAAALQVANTAPEEELDVDVGLDSRAAENIVAERDRNGPFATLAELDAVPYVGTTALGLLVEYGLSAPAPAGACLILSEVIEGSGIYNKAIELYNCGAAPLDLSAFGVCLVRNDDTSCTLSDPLPAAWLDPGAVHTACRSVDGTWMDPHPTIRDRCRIEMPGTLNFDGNDRIVVFELETGRVLDMLGRFTWVPSTPVWGDRVLRRCNPEPWTDTGFYETAEFFTEHPRSHVDDYGVAPVLDGCP